MAIQFKDYYKILGVSRQAGDEEVRRAFRKLARVFHPDVTGNDRSAEDRFKEINEAYEVLGDRHKRQRYDQFNSTYQNRSADEAWAQFSAANTGAGPSRAGSQETKPHFTFRGSNFSEFFEQLFGENAPTGATARTDAPPAESDGRGDDLEADLWVTLDEVAHGAIRPIEMRRAVRCQKCLGVGQHHAIRCEDCHGAGSVLSTVNCSVKIPAGIAEGALLRIPGKGEEGALGTEPGDLYLKVHYRPHHDFHLERGQLTYDLEIAPWEAVLGASVSVPTLSGRISIKIPAGSQNGQKLRIRSRGLPAADGAAGDLFVKIKVQVPASSGAREIELWQELARESKFSPRET